MGTAEVESCVRAAREKESVAQGNPRLAVNLLQRQALRLRKCPTDYEVYGNGSVTSILPCFKGQKELYAQNVQL